MNYERLSSFSGTFIGWKSFSHKGEQKEKKKFSLKAMKTTCGTFNVSIGNECELEKLLTFKFPFQSHWLSKKKEREEIFISFWGNPLMFTFCSIGQKSESRANINLYIQIYRFFLACKFIASMEMMEDSSLVLVRVTES